MIISKISEFPKVTPSAEDKILIEKNSEGGHINLSEMPVSTPVSTRIASEVSTLNSRIDNIVASSGDDISEIVDARQGSDGTNYASLRARLDAENNQLKGDLDNVKTHTSLLSNVGLNKFDYKNSKNKTSISTSDGTEYENQYRFVSDFISLNGCNRLYLANYPYENDSYHDFPDSSAVVFYDENKNFVSGFENIALNGYEVPNNAHYMRFSRDVTNGDASTNKSFVLNFNYDYSLYTKYYVDNLPSSFLNVSQFDSKGDGVANDSDAFIRPIKAMKINSHYNTLYIPAGIYKISNLILLTSNITVVGENVYNTILQLDDNVSSGIYAISGTESEPIINVEIKNITFKAKIDDVNIDDHSRTLIGISNASLIKIHDCIFHNFDHSAILVYDTYPIGQGMSVDIYNNLFYNDSFHFGCVGIYFYRQAEYCSISNNRITKLNVGIVFENSANDRIENNHLSSNILGIKITQNDENYNSGKHIVCGNTINHGSQGGIFIDQMSRSLISKQGGSIIANNTILIVNLFGIKIKGGYGHIVNSNKIITLETTDVGIELNDSDYGDTIEQSIITSNIVGCNIPNTSGVIICPQRNNVIANNIKMTM